MNETLMRAVRLVLAAYLRYPGTTPHHYTCEKGKPGKGCNCGANDLNEAMRLLARALVTTGEDLPQATPEQVTAEIDILIKRLDP
jgi:hypothetical protein